MRPLSCRLSSACRFLPFFGMFLLCAVICSAQDSKCSLQAELSPPQLSLTSNSSLTVTSTCPATTLEQVLEVTPPPGFTISPRSYQLGNSSGAKVRAFEVQTPRTYLPREERRISILLSSKDGELASISFSFTYGLGLSLGAYFLLGAFGIAVGYVMRLIVDSLNAIPKPVVPAARAAAPVEGAVIPDLGWFTQFMKDHYYLMDFLVTLILGFLALGAVVKDNHAPDSGLYWYSALGLGFGIGLLTNSDLVTRLRTR